MFSRGLTAILSLMTPVELDGGHDLLLPALDVPFAFGILLQIAVTVVRGNRAIMDVAASLHALLEGQVVEGPPVVGVRLGVPATEDALGLCQSSTWILGATILMIGYGGLTNFVPSLPSQIFRLDAGHETASSSVGLKWKLEASLAFSFLGRATGLAVAKVTRRRNAVRRLAMNVRRAILEFDSSCRDSGYL